MKNLAITLVFAAILIAIAIRATDKICDKNWSKEFKQTEQYKEMQCPTK